MKYMGSKSRIAYNLLPIILRGAYSGQTYAEPFVGGCNMIDKIPRDIGLNLVASDVNPYLIAMWQGLQQGFLAKGWFPIDIPKELYTIHRNRYNSHRGSKVIPLTDKEKAIVGWVGYMGSFNGRFFDGGYSGHDVNGRDYIEEQIQNTIKQTSLIQDVKFSYNSYAATMYPTDTIVYCDIPYEGTKQYGVSTGFNHRDFYQWARVMSEYHRIFISEYNAPSDFVELYSKPVTNSLNPTKTINSVEKLFMYKKSVDKYGIRL